MPSPEPAANPSPMPVARIATPIERSSGTPGQNSQHAPGLQEPEPNGIEQARNSTPTERQDAILEGKQKAKAILAADANRPGAPDDSRMSSRTASKSPGNASMGTPGNGELSRKRSRSGSRKPSSPSSAPAPAKPRPTYEQLTRAQNRFRGEVAQAALNQQSEARRRLLHHGNSETDELKGTLIQELEAWKRIRRCPAQVVYGRGFEGYGNGWTGSIPDAANAHEAMLTPGRIRYPEFRKRPGNRQTAELRIPRKDMELQADQLEQLVPIRLDIDFEKLRLRDTFTWNMHERVIQPAQFAQGLVEDFGIPNEHRPVLTQQVHQAINEQVSDYHPHIFIDYGPLDPLLPYSAYKNDEMRVLVKLNITIGQHALVDQFDWDINNTLNSPEEFAMRMAKDLSLSGEFMTAIAHSIREQTQMFTRSLYISGHPFDGRPIEDPDIRENMLPSPLPSVFRTFQAAKDFAPYFYELNDADLERAELAFTREQRQQKRSVNRRGGPSLPDLKERLRTSRTMLVSSVIPGAALNEDESGIYKPSRMPSGPGRGRRAMRGETAGESDLSETDDSDPESPTRGTHASIGTSRTRGMRGAASVAHAAMRANLTRSATPESLHHHHETRTSIRRLGGHEGREDSILHDGDKLIVKLKVTPAKFRHWLRDYKNRRHRDSHHHHHNRQSSVASSSHPFRASPSQTPGPAARPLTSASTPNNRLGTPSAARTTPTATSGAPQAQPTGPAPPPPAWLLNALETLREDYPYDDFKPAMRWNNNEQIWQPRIRCSDCTVTWYNTIESDPTSNFLMHLKNSKHRQKVQARLAASVSSASSTTTTTTTTTT